ncbi:CHAP domain-containing protein [Lentzea sp. NPDC051838]|uniref:CHAP domain-containing protein n=1 Tax=Lentzea sp. NPDC051838 TaxID=3154849 RepID=UPI0034278D7C
MNALTRIGVAVAVAASVLTPLTASAASHPCAGVAGGIRVQRGPWICIGHESKPLNIIADRCFATAGSIVEYFPGVGSKPIRCATGDHVIEPVRTVSLLHAWKRPDALTKTAVLDGQLADDYPHKNGSWHDPDQWNFYKRECVSFVAWRIRERLGIPFHNHWKTHWGNAKNWDDAARKIGLKVNDNPAVGAVAQWNSGEFGHVAWVAQVKGNEVFLEEYNKGGSHNYGSRWIKASAVENFIHFKS